MLKMLLSRLPLAVSAFAFAFIFFSVLVDSSTNNRSEVLFFFLFFLSRDLLFVSRESVVKQRRSKDMRFDYDKSCPTSSIFILFPLSFLVESQVKCSRICIAENCNSVGIRYGKYCGVGWSGCPGEKPCDDLDACCKIHDECVEKKGMTNIKCHEKFKTCIKKVQKSGKDGFSQDCPYDTAVPTMIQGMDLAILLSQFGSSKFEL
ncbi:hypothetical protein K2173_016272 [Erythroxylum novogranatense]|uniref:phospholipase A2 n=1 Tax=Erythroxylum novogranatense TaxID=1862640 RepID=A0AAV8SFR7_9ROSI|nr:hypothetical protein K2173_016272 [Erythroxylum novogranatense]